MAFAVWWGILNLVLTAALLAAVVYLFVLIVRALKKYIGSREVRDEKQAAKRTLGETLKAHRTRCQMTQEFEAEALGVSRQTVSKWENGQRRPQHNQPACTGKAVWRAGGGADMGRGGKPGCG